MYDRLSSTSRTSHDACSVLRLEFETARQLRITNAMLTLALLIGMASFVALLVLRNTVVRPMASHKVTASHALLVIELQQSAHIVFVPRSRLTPSSSATMPWST